MHHNGVAKKLVKLYHGKTILDMIARVIGVVWCVRSYNAEFC